MKLYYAKGACSLAPHIIINEIGAQCEYELVNLATKKFSSDEDFFRINPKGSVPVLVTDQNETLTEGVVIMQYLADKYDANQLLPAIGTMARYHTLEWLNYVATELHKTIGMLFKTNLTDEMREQFCLPLSRAKLAYVDKNLLHTYLLGEEFTLPDAYLFVILTWVQHFKFDMQEWPRLRNYFSNLQKRASIIKSLREEKIVPSIA